MPLEYGGLVGGAGPNKPLKGSKGYKGPTTLLIYPGGRVEAQDGVVTLQDGAAAISDASFDETPPDGTMAIGFDGTNDAIYVRVGGAWKSVAVS